MAAEDRGHVDLGDRDVIVSKSVQAAVADDTSKVYTPGPWASVGVQLKTPSRGDRRAGRDVTAVPSARLKVRVLAGTSASVAVAVKPRATPR